jgi:hypothetical protein
MGTGENKNVVPTPVKYLVKWSSVAADMNVNSKHLDISAAKFCYFLPGVHSLLSVPLPSFFLSSSLCPLSLPLPSALHLLL